MTKLSELIESGNINVFKDVAIKSLDEKKASFIQEKKIEIAQSVLNEEDEINEEDPNMDVDIDPVEFDLSDIEELEKAIWDEEMNDDFEDAIEDEDEDEEMDESFLAEAASPKTIRELIKEYGPKDAALVNVETNPKSKNVVATIGVSNSWLKALETNLKRYNLADKHNITVNGSIQAKGWDNTITVLNGKLGEEK